MQYSGITKRIEHYHRKGSMFCGLLRCSTSYIGKIVDPTHFGPTFLNLIENHRLRDCGNLTGEKSDLTND
jgi:hypothetical protein